ncbi:MAG: hypothetical protein HZA17_07215 [Nitrospirae bacterium]|nr:hypothetical protein [Nitrospirota bacterium]
MRLTHEEIKGLLPEYAGASLSKEMMSDMQEHINGCEDCREELSLLAQLADEEVPDPGELFWKTLPKKVRLSAEEEKAARPSFWSYLFRPMPAASAVLVALLVIVYMNTYTSVKNLDMAVDPYINESATEVVMNESDITEADMYQVTQQVIGEELAEHPEDFQEYSYYREVAMMSSEEIDSFYEALKKEEKGG